MSLAKGIGEGESCGLKSGNTYFFPFFFFFWFSFFPLASLPSEHLQSTELHDGLYRWESKTLRHVHLSDNKKWEKGPKCENVKKIPERGKLGKEIL